MPSRKQKAKRLPDETAHDTPKESRTGHIRDALQDFGLRDEEPDEWELAVSQRILRLIDQGVLQQAEHERQDEDFNKDAWTFSAIEADAPLKAWLEPKMPTSKERRRFATSLATTPWSQVKHGLKSKHSTRDLFDTNSPEPQKADRKRKLTAACSAKPEARKKIKTEAGAGSTTAIHDKDQDDDDDNISVIELPATSPAAQQSPAANGKRKAEDGHTQLPPAKKSRSAEQLVYVYLHDMLQPRGSRFAYAGMMLWQTDSEEAEEQETKLRMVVRRYKFNNGMTHESQRAHTQQYPILFGPEFPARMRANTLRVRLADESRQVVVAGVTCHAVAFFEPGAQDECFDDAQDAMVASLKLPGPPNAREMSIRDSVRPSDGTHLQQNSLRGMQVVDSVEDGGSRVSPVDTPSPLSRVDPRHAHTTASRSSSPDDGMDIDPVSPNVRSAPNLISSDRVTPRIDSSQAGSAVSRADEVAEQPKPSPPTDLKPGSEACSSAAVRPSSTVELTSADATVRSADDSPPETTGSAVTTSGNNAPTLGHRATPNCNQGSGTTSSRSSIKPVQTSTSPVIVINDDSDPGEGDSGSDLVSNYDPASYLTDTQVQDTDEDAPEPVTPFGPTDIQPETEIQMMLARLNADGTRARVNAEADAMMSSIFPALGPGPLSPRVRIDLPCFVKGRAPFLFQVYSAVWYLTSRREFEQIDERKIRHPMGGIIAHDMGVGKTCVFLSTFILNLCVLRMTQDLSSNPALHLTSDAEPGAKCPSGAWRGVMRCLCEKGNPLRLIKGAYGATAYITLPGLLPQSGREFAKFIDADAFLEVFGFQFQVRFAYEVSDGGRFDAAFTSNGQLALPAPTEQQWAEANPEYTPDQLALAYLDRDGAWFAPDRRQMHANHKIGGLIIVTTPACASIRLLPGIQNISTPSLQPQYLCTRADGQACWSKACTKTSKARQHFCAGQVTPTSFLATQLAMIAIDEAHDDHAGPNLVKTLSTINKVHRHQSLPHPSLFPMTGTPLASSFLHMMPFLIAQQVPLDELPPVDEEEDEEEEEDAGVSGTQPQRQARKDFYQALKNLREWCHLSPTSMLGRGVWNKLSRDLDEAMGPRTRRTAMAYKESKDRFSLVKADLEDFAAATGTSLGPDPDFGALLRWLTKQIETLFDATLHRYTVETEWTNKEKLLLMMPTKFERLETQFTAAAQAQLEPFYDQYTKVAASLRELDLQPERSDVDDEDNAEARKDLSLQVDRMSKICSMATAVPYMLDVPWPNRTKDRYPIFMSTICAEEKVYAQSELHPAHAYGRQLYESSPKLQAICASIMQKYNEGDNRDISKANASRQRSSGKKKQKKQAGQAMSVERHIAPVAISLQHAPLGPIVKFALDYYFSQHQPGLAFECAYFYPSQKGADKDLLVRRFEGAVGNEPLLDILILPAALGGTGINLAFCHHMYHLQVLAKISVHGQMEARIQRLGQHHDPVFFYQCVDTSFAAEDGMLVQRARQADRIKDHLKDKQGSAVTPQ